MRFTAAGYAKLRRAVWLLLAVVVVMFASLSVASVLHYTGVAYAKLAMEANASLSLTATDLDPSGRVTDQTVFHYNVTVNVTNPSSSAIEFQLIRYKGWVRDYIYERQQGGGGATKYYYAMLHENRSYDPTAGRVAAGSMKAFIAEWDYDLASHPESFTWTKTILNNFTETHPGQTWRDAEWNHFYAFLAIVSDIPLDYTGPSSGYLIELPVVRRYQGINLVGSTVGEVP